MQLEQATLRRLWPRAPGPLVEAVAAHSAAVFARYGLSTKLRVAHFLAQVSHESGGGTITAENLNYTNAARIAAVWPRRFTIESAASYVHNPEKLADAVYNGRMGNRPGSGDGYAYRGRGLLQLTGRSSYRDIGALTGLPLEERPELAAAPAAALEVAAAEFRKLGCLPYCDADNCEAVTRRVNGGYTGLASRKAWLARWKAAIIITGSEPAPEKDIPPGVGVPDQGSGGDANVSEENFPPPPVEIPRGSDEVLPPAVDDPDKTMAGSKTGWAAVLATVTGIGATVGQALDQVRPLLSDPRTLAIVVAVIAGAGLFIWLDRRAKLKAGHV